MKRKVIKQGNGTLTITLPKEWTKKAHLKGGEEVDVKETEYSLVVSKDLPGKERAASLRLTGEAKRYIRSIIGRVYREGYGTINITFDEPGLIKEIKKASNDLIGADVIDFESNSCIVKIFPTEELRVDIDKNLAKMVNTVKYMLNIIKEDIKSSKFCREDTLSDLRSNNWKMKDYIIRNLFLKNAPYEDFSVINVLLFSYEKLGTDLLKFYRIYLQGKKSRISLAPLEPVFEKLTGFLEWFSKAISRNQEIPVAEENKIRKDMRDYHTNILNGLHVSKADHSFLTIAYLSIELLDSTVSYLSLYKMKYSNDYPSEKAIS